MLIGNWKGYYSFENTKINEIRGFEKTNFDVEIVQMQGNSFTGKVRDDLATGGTEGVGEITGVMNENRVEFVKKMPVLTLLIDRKGTRKTLNKKHTPIYYTGEFSTDKKQISGTWKFKFGFIWMGLLPIPVIPSKGTWCMRRTD